MRISYRQVHERTIESDFLLIVLKSLLEQRSDLKSVGRDNIFLFST